MIVNPLKGEVAFTIMKDNNIHNSNPYTIRWGIIGDKYSEGTELVFYSLKDYRYINGIPIMEFYQKQNEYKSFRLPKNWGDIELYELTNVIPEEEQKLIEQCNQQTIPDTELLKVMCNKGIFIPEEQNLQLNIQTNIESRNATYRIEIKPTKSCCTYKNIYEYPHCIMQKHELFSDYSEAKNIVNAYNKEFFRKLSLSDRDWMLEDISEVITKAKVYNQITKDEGKMYYDYFEKMTNDELEKIEYRCNNCLNVKNGLLQVRKVGHKKWNTIAIVDHYDGKYVELV